VVQAVSTGFAGAYVRNGTGFEMVVSVMRKEATGRWYTDHHAPTDVLVECLKHGGKTVTRWGYIDGE